MLTHHNLPEKVILRFCHFHWRTIAPLQVLVKYWINLAKNFQFLLVVDHKTYLLIHTPRYFVLSEHVEFTLMMDYHEHSSEQYKQQLSTAEEDDLNSNDVATGNFDDGLDELGDHEINGDINALRESDEIRSETTVTSVQKISERQDILFKSTYETLKHKMCMAFETDTIERFLKEMEEKAYIRDMKDHLGRTFLHIAVEEQNINFVQCLIHGGFNPNAKEKCGIHPIIISIILKSQEMCQLLERPPVYQCS